jgi:hypothetical protein
MSKFKKITNAVTGKTEYQFPATLVSINTNSPQTFTNASGVENSYYLGAVDFVNANGEEKKGVTTQIFAKSFNHGMKVGDTYLSVVSKGDDNKMYIRTSHLIAGGNNATEEDFGLDFDMVEELIATEA